MQRNTQSSTERELYATKLKMVSKIAEIDIYNRAIKVI